MPQPKKKKSVPARKASKSSSRASSRASSNRSSSNRASSKKAPVVEIALAEESSVALAEAPQDEPETPLAVIEEIPIASSTPEEGSPELHDSDLRAEEPAGEAVAEILSPDAGAALSNPAELDAALEALLFASPEPLSPKKLANALETGDGGPDQKTIREALMRLAARYEIEGRGLQIIEIHGGYRMGTREKYVEFIYRLGAKKKRAALSPATLETLAIIAYRQPVIRAVVETIRGVESSGTIRNLLDMGLIEITGYKEVIGRPPMYGTTAKFLSAFGLRSLSDLPSIRGLKERFATEEAILTAPSEPVKNGEPPAAEETGADAAQAEAEIPHTAEGLAAAELDSLAIAAEDLAGRIEEMGEDEDEFDEDEIVDEDAEDEYDEDEDEDDDGIVDEDDEDFDEGEEEEEE